MSENDIGLMIFVAFVVAIVIHINLRKLTKQLDKKTADTSSYLVLCNEVIKIISKLHEEHKIDEINDFVKTINHIKTMYINNPKTLESKLTECLLKLDEFIKQKIPNGEKVADEVREQLKKVF